MKLKDKSEGLTGITKLFLTFWKKNIFLNPMKVFHRGLVTACVGLMQDSHYALIHLRYVTKSLILGGELMVKVMQSEAWWHSLVCPCMHVQIYMLD